MYQLYILISSLLIAVVTSFTPNAYNYIISNTRRYPLLSTSAIERQCSSSILVSSSSSSSSSSIKNKNTILFSSDVQGDTSINESITNTSNDNEEDDDDEWEYEEYEMLTETDFYDSEWKVGTLIDGSSNIDETWTRLVVKDGEFICVWGDGADGKWNFDPASQFLSMSKDSFGGWMGKRIWAGTVDDFYYVQGSIRGWSPISPASVIGQWQAKRLGVDKEEAGVAPWFEEEEEEDDDDDEEETSKSENNDSDNDSDVEQSNEAEDSQEVK